MEGWGKPPHACQANYSYSLSPLWERVRVRGIKVASRCPLTPALSHGGEREITSRLVDLPRFLMLPPPVLRYFLDRYGRFQ